MKSMHIVASYAPDVGHGDPVSPEVTRDPIGHNGNLRKQAFKELAGTIELNILILVFYAVYR